MAPGHFTPSKTTCVGVRSWVLVLPLPPPELGTLFQPDVPVPQVATATAKPRPAPYAHREIPEVFSSLLPASMSRAASLEEQRSLPTAPMGGAPPPCPLPEGTKERESS